jgi:hypothetical protein
METKRYKKTINAAEMKFMRHTAGCSLLDRRRKEDILEELQLDPVKGNYQIINKNG